jgi:hypothetical protein
MHVDPLLPVAVEMFVAILLLAVILKRLKQR